MMMRREKDDDVRLAFLLAAFLLAAVLAAPAAGLADEGGTTDLVHGWYIGVNDTPTPASDNAVTVSKTYDNAAGGYSSTTPPVHPGGTASNNALTIHSGGKISKNAYGGYADSSGQNADAEASHNTLTVKSGGALSHGAYGGYAYSRYSNAEASHNTLTIESGARIGYNTPDAVDIFGGVANAGNSMAATATGNTVVINGGTFLQGFGSIYGGYASGGPSSSATDNTVILGGALQSDALKNLVLVGGYAGGTVSGNTLEVRAGNLTVKGIEGFQKYRFAADVLNAVSPVITMDGQGSNPTIDAEKVSLDASRGLSVGFGDSVTLLKITNATDKTISLSNTTGTTRLDGEDDGLTVTKHTLSTSDGNKTLKVSVSELYLYGSGGTNTEGQRARGNTLTLDARTGRATAAFGGRAASGDVTGNTLVIDAPVTLVNNVDSVFSGKAFGGCADAGNATGNTVVLTENLTGRSLDFPVYGGWSGSGGDAVTGNALEVWAKGVSVKSVQNFEHFHFILPRGVASGDTVLTVTDGQPTTFVKKANIGVTMASGAKLNKGDTVTLIRNAAGFAGEGYRKVSLAGKTLKGTGGVSLKYDFELSDTPSTIDATVTSVAVNEQAKAIVEARAASVGIANAGADLAAGQGMHSALSATSALSGLSSGDGNDGFVIAPFFAVSGGTQRLESGSYVDVSGVAAVLGLAARKDLDAVALTGGIFFEYGTSSFSTHNGFASGDVDGRGHASYTGGGLLARLDLTSTLLKGLYLEGSFRFGGMKSDWHSDDLRDAATGRRASYDMYSPYVGAHVGLGYVWQATDSFKVDLYGKWLWTRVYGDDVRVADDPYEFKDVDSYRLRFGVRADWNVTEQIGLYAGAAWEHEFDGKARATAYGYDTPSPTVKGDTGVFDLGVSLRPGAVPGLTMELGATATAGVRHGIMGNLMVKYEF